LFNTVGLYVKQSRLLRSWRKSRQKKRPVSRGLDANQKWLKESLTETLGCRVEIRAKSKNRGCLEIWYDSPDDLERFLGLVGLES
jgi:hypothetical protein